MPFVSYAQNNEDVLLWRALSHVPNGFYIDVGANDPVEHSVTKAFYDAGWRGINVEPLPAHIAAFDAQRPRDVNLAIAAGSSDGELTLYDVPDVRGWASPEAAVAEMHRAEGHRVAELTVPVRTLASVCAEHVDGKTDAIHFLKIDVEGFEGEVLRGMDFARWRPWVLVVEATLPGSRETAHESWDHLVTSQRYRYVWFDGLNRYYVAEEHPELLAHFGTQPNVFDDYISHHLDKAWEANRAAQDALRQAEGNAQRALRTSQENADRIARELEAHAQVLRTELHNVRAHRDVLEREKLAVDAEVERLSIELAQAQASAADVSQWARELETRLVATLNSTSWKITAPLRLVARRGPDSLPNLARRKAKGAARRGLRWLTTREALRRAVLPVVMRSPRLQELVSRTLTAAKQATADGALLHAPVPPAQRELPQSAREALEQLRRAFEPNKD